MKKFLILLLMFGSVGLSSCLKGGVDPYKAAQDQMAKDEVIIKKFIADNNIPAIRHESGIYYQIIEPGTGNHTYTASSQTTVNYKGRLLDGTVFDQSKGVITYPLGNFIVGWQIGVPLIQKGGKLRLIIPSGYAYGANGSNTIPANAVLDFDIELVDVQ